MLVDLFHNQIIAAVATKQFTDSVEDVLVPLISEAYGDSVTGICMYEDHLADGFLSEGEWFYPLTVLTEDGTDTAWVKWSVANKKSFKGGVPYAYVGEEPLSFELADDVPAEFVGAMEGRAVTYDPKSIKIKVHTTATDPLVLVGKYSQSFVDELARQITADISRTMSVSGIADCTIQLELVFAPDTYMEHTSENVTYRRLLLTDKGCQARDFWVKWTRLDGAFGYSVTDAVNADTIRFEIGEDVPQKIREKEYRFLCRSNPGKYQSAMGKRTATEWRELIKRLIKHGLIEKIELPLAEDGDDEVTRRLIAVLGDDYRSEEEESTDTDDDFDDIAAMARAVLGGDAADESEVIEQNEQTEDIEEDEELEEFEEIEEVEEVEEFEEIEEAEEVEEIEEAEDGEFVFGLDIPDTAESVPEQDTLEAVDETEDDEARREYAELDRIREERIRAEVEARVRLEYEAEARAKAEAEAERLRIEHERLKAENARLLEEARIAEEQRAAKEAERLAEEQRRREEEERVRARIAEQARLEAEERARLAETARIALEEQKRLENEQRAREERERELAELRERERLEREAEERRIELQRLAEERRRMEAAAAARAAEPKEPTVTYVTKHAKLIFRRMVDLNVVKRIKEIVEETLVRNHKEHVRIHMKAYAVDSYTLNLDIMKIPESEGELLVAIVKAIGNGNLGITKIIVE